MSINSFIALTGLLTALAIMLSAIRCGASKIVLFMKTVMYFFTVFLVVTISVVTLVNTSKTKEIKTYPVSINNTITYNNKTLTTDNLRYKTTKSKTYLEVETTKFYFLYDNKYTLYVNN